MNHHSNIEPKLKRYPTEWMLIIVVGLLVAVYIFPIFSTKPSPGRVESCLTNVKHLSVALSMYAEDADDRYPPAPRWRELIERYHRDDRHLRCTVLRESDQAGFGYAFNSLLAGEPTELEHPERVPVVFESSDLTLNAHYPDLVGIASPPRHDSGNAVAYANGNAIWKRELP